MKMKVEILTQSHKRTEQIENTLRLVAHALDIELEISRTGNFKAYTHLSINPSQTPLVIINGNLEFAGKLPHPDSVKMRLSQIRSHGDGMSVQ